MTRLVLLLLLLTACPKRPPEPEPLEPCIDACLLQSGAMYQVCLQACRAPRLPVK